MLAMDSRVCKAVEVVAGCSIWAEGRWVLIPAGVVEGIVGPRGAVHDGGGGDATLVFSCLGRWRGGYDAGFNTVLAASGANRRSKVSGRQ